VWQLPFVDVFKELDIQKGKNATSMGDVKLGMVS
jgi:hypothetical protein